MSEESLFHLALEKPAGERAAFLEEACGGDPALRQRVEALLAAHQNPGSFLREPAVNLGLTAASQPGRHPGEEGDAPAPRPLGEGAGSRIGPYKLLQQIGEGGMGAVFLAEQTQPVQRRVALKLIKPGMDSGQVLARFEAERQALALMDHPHIARVLDAGTTESGLPYFVMELVKGVPLTRFCDERHLTPRQRLELFVPVCQAVQHAHTKGIIHRDLKPSNVLVALYDDKAVPKVIDFGVAKALGQKLTERTLFTEFGSIVGTLEYMSPEQAQLNQLDIDTRSDVYSLGVLLYELLTGTTPLDRKRCEQASFLELLRIIREEEPPRPSTRLSTTEELPAIAANRGVEPKKLSGLVRGELDWIVMKCLEKDRSRRYETANGLARDIERYLADEPVQACPPSPGYRLRKFLRRHKGPVLAAALVFVALLAGTAVSLYFALDSRVARNRADADAEKARANEAQAIAARDRTRRTLYVARMSPMWRFWQESKITTVRELLRELEPGPGEPDVRGWEWHYQWRLAHPELRLLEGHQPRTLHREDQTLAFSPDGRWLVSGGMAQDTDLIVWDLATGKELRRLRDPAGNMRLTRRLAFSPDGKTLASGEGWGQERCTVRLWDVPSGRLLHTLKGHDEQSIEGISELAFSPDGRQLASLVNFDVGSSAGLGAPPPDKPHEGTVKLWDVATGRPLHTWQTRLVDFLAFLRTGQVLTVATLTAPSGKAVVAFHEPSTGKELKSFTIDNKDYLAKVTASADGRWLAVADRDGGLRFWDLERGVLVRSMEGPKRVPGGKLTSFRPYAMVFSPEDRRLAVAEYTGTVKVHDVQTGKPLTTFRVLEADLFLSGIVICVAFSPDGQRLAAQGDDGPIRILDSYTAEGEVRTFREGIGAQSPAFTPDGKRLVALAPGTNLPQPWDVVSGHKLPGPRGGGGPVAYSPDGRWLAAVCAEGIRVWDATTYRELRTISGIPDFTGLPGVIALAFGPQGRLAAVTRGGEEAVSVWDAASGRKLLSFKGHAESVRGLAFSRDGRRLAVVSHGRGQPEGQLNVWDAATGQELLTVKARFTGGLAHSPDGRLLATTELGTVRLRDAATGKEVRSFEENAAVVAFSPDGRWLAAGGVVQVRVWDLSDGKEVCHFKARAGTARNLAFSPDSRWLAVTGLDTTTRVWEVATGQERMAVEAPLHLADFGIAFSPDGQRLALGTGGVKTVRICDPATGAEVRTLGGHPVGATCLAVSPDGRTVASGGVDRVVRLWDAKSLEPLRVFRGHTATVQVVAFSPDGRLLASGDSEPDPARGGEVRVWDMAGGQELHRLRGHPRGLLAMAFSADAQQLASVSVEGTVKVWDLARGRELHSGKVPFKPAEPNKAEAKLVVAFSPDRRRSPPQDPPEGTIPWLLASGGADNRLRLWDLSANREVGVLTGHGDTRATALTFSPDGRRLVSASQGTIKFWDMVTRQELYAFPHDNVKIVDLAFSVDGRRLVAAGQRLVMWDAQPLTPEEAVEREALGLLDWLFSRPLPRQEVLERLRTHPAISEQVRRRALEVAAHFREEDNPRPYAAAARALARQAHLTADWYRLALSQAEAACALAPEDGYGLTALGVAQYRLGKYPEALQTLIRADRINATPAGGSVPADLALLALTHHQLGNPDAARAHLERLRQGMAKDRGKRPNDEEAGALLAEAEMRIEGKRLP
jgi:WD40 repeat protein/serine/threonine protein kinase